jgi:hypothetical protein
VRAERERYKRKSENGEREPEKIKQIEKTGIRETRENRERER